MGSNWNFFLVNSRKLLQLIPEIRRNRGTPKPQFEANSFCSMVFRAWRALDAILPHHELRPVTSPRTKDGKTNKLYICCSYLKIFTSHSQTHWPNISDWAIRMRFDHDTHCWIRICRVFEYYDIFCFNGASWAAECFFQPVLRAHNAIKHLWLPIW